MLRSAVLLSLVLFVGFAASDVVSCATQASAAMQVLQRIIPTHAAKFVLQCSDPTNGQYVGQATFHNPKYTTFTVSARNGTVTVKGNSGVALTAGAYWYLKRVGNCLVTWGVNGTGDQLSLPAVLPDVASTTTTSATQWQYAWNMCTFSYSAAFWNAPRWQREVDWMALHGVNLPLALTAQEWVWVQVFQQLNTTLAQLEAWFSGPAFLAWQRAGNIRGWAGPLSMHWIDGQRELQHSILSQMRSLGMTPVLPCFGGHVPSVVQTLFPNARLTQSPAWNNFMFNESDVYYLDPTDGLYHTLGKMFMDVLIAEFGTDHFYSCDTFNEVDPTSNEPSYLKAAGAAVVTAISAGDTNGVWVMQAWLFHFGFWTYDNVKAYLSGVADDAMVILDLNAEDGALAPQFDQYFGKKWIWNMLHNYGGVRGVYGNLTRIATGPMADLNVSGSTMIGIGFTPEAIEQNPVMYELLTSTFWTRSSIPVMPWLQSYVRQRYGVESAKAWNAWQKLFQAVYDQPGEPRSEIEHVPTWMNPDFGWQHGDATGMLQAWEAYMLAATDLPNAATNGPYQYDLVDVTRQSITMFFSDVHRVLVSAMYSQGNDVTIRNTTRLMLQLIQLLDQLLGTNSNFLLGEWTNAAASWASGPADVPLMLLNAKNQITMWGPDAQINDYAAKAWHDLYGTYYYGRWQIFAEQLTSGQQWNEWGYQQSILSFERVWNNNQTRFSALPTGMSAMDVAQHLHGVVASPQALQSYQLFPSTTTWGQSLAYTMWTTDPRQLAILCDLYDGCTGFAQDGRLLTGSLERVSQSGSSLWVKNVGDGQELRA